MGASERRERHTDQLNSDTIGAMTHAIVGVAATSRMGNWEWDVVTRSTVSCGQNSVVKSVIKQPFHLPKLPFSSVSAKIHSISPQTDMAPLANIQRSEKW